MKKIQVKIGSFLLIVSLILGGIGIQSPVAAAEKISGTHVLNQQNTTFVSLQGAFKAYGGTCSISGNKAVAKKGSDSVKVTAGSNVGELNGTKIQMTDKAVAKNNDLYVPISFLTEVMDARVQLSSDKKSVTIESKMNLSYAKGFSITYLKGGVKSISDGKNNQYVLLPKGKTAPKGYEYQQRIEIPVTNIIAASTTQACQLRALGVLSSIKGVTTKQDQWRIPEVAEALKAGKIKYLGENQAPDYELIKTMKPQAVFNYSGSGHGADKMIEKLVELDIKTVIFDEWLEDDPRGRMEWIKLYAAFYNKEDVADAIFDKAMVKIDKIVANTKGKAKPKVSWGMVSSGKVYIAGPGTYAAKMIEMAGGDYVFKDLKNAEGGNISLEEFYAKSKDADILIYSSMQQYTPDMKSITDQSPILAGIAPIKNQKVWCLAPDYWQSVDKTDEIIQDLYDIVQEGSSQTKHFVKY